MRLQCLNARLIDVIDALRSVVAVFDEACILEHPKMLRNCRPGQWKSLSQFDHRQRSVGQTLQDCKPRRVTYCMQPRSKVSRHLR